jgi:DNA-binding MarR family transcriptional regulator
MQPSTDAARGLAVVLHDLGWLLPRTIGAEAAKAEPLPASELEVMRLLTRRPGLRVAEVGRELGMHPNNVSTALRSLVARGLVLRTTDARDGRAARLEPSDAAVRSRERREERWSAAMTEVLAQLGDDERTTLLDAVTALRALADRLGAG